MNGIGGTAGCDGGGGGKGLGWGGFVTGCLGGGGLPVQVVVVTGVPLPLGHSWAKGEVEGTAVFANIFPY